MSLASAGSDYGSEFDDEESNAHLITLLDVIETRHANPLSSYTFEDINKHDGPNVVKVPTGSSSQLPIATSDHNTSSRVFNAQQDSPAENISLKVEEQYEQRSPQSSKAHQERPGRINFANHVPSDDIPDSRSPLERFRTAPKKPLSVTDLVSPAWCELQYWYVLTKHGKKRQTPAMKQGSAVHKSLEEQVHQTVSVEVQTREDHWGLRIWNIIQGLRTLRETGITRELEIWGIVDSQVVNGVIDEVSFTCTDPEMETAIGKAERRAAQLDHKPLPEDQTTIAEFFSSQNSATGSENKRRRKKNKAAPTASKVYITDVKTRMSSSLPKGSGLRTTITQLMLYRKLLGEIANGLVDSSALFSRYRLNPSKSFSDSLLAQLGSIDFSSSPSNDESHSTTNTLDELLNHNNLAELWALMIEEYQKVMPAGAESVSKVLRAEFRAQVDGSIIGARTFAHKEEELQRYLDDEMSWWKGEREAKGVEIEEAYKCRVCEFAEDCTWRIKRAEESAQGSKVKKVASA